MTMKRDISRATTDLSHASEGGDAGETDRYFEGALQTVRCAALAGGLLIAASAVWAVLDGDLLVALLNSLAGFMIVALGVRGVSRKEPTYLICFTIMSCLAMVYSFVKVVLCVAFVLAVHARPASDIQQAFRNSKSKVITLYVLESLVSMSLTLFWTVAGYSSYRLVRLLEERRSRIVQRHHLNVIRDTIEATVLQVRPTDQARDVASKN
eukprot:Gregarina_sp_Poly_1__3481@NODE_200_length_11544_cov_123_517644_g179_i0_p6_GENE_NODE_200_length_11544_cov_123_517644_g179_i0NODE_200_length_11544_cov_123_517644_g179_i0_p6_ORF_typecomplete_len210_score19_04Mtp/PF03821_16/0_015Jagunal/PF07086_12/12Jagunal/PF07086_12/2DUF5336/PF17270_2/0_41Tetraspanin/PF00335_20/0_5PMT_2/PF13231_6/2_6PMT_2/PF13231_6/1e02Patched/PF02460_18/1_1e03Patched/PF02460_18/0_46_NODE_200_length_11544_cov_123_517644_g179_i051235752